MISFVLPTRDRPAELSQTLAAIAELPNTADQRHELIVVDNASAKPVQCPEQLSNGVQVRVIRNETNEGAAGRNVGVRSADADCEWVILLDDDSAPIDDGYLSALREQPEEVAAVTADITLPDGSRERGGLPEVPVGCGVAVRRWAFLAAGGYDHAFGFYAEEYDLAAKLLLADRRVVFDPRFRVLHRKTSAGRDMGLILERLVRNNGWVLGRYCPDDELAERLHENETRYREIANKERATSGFERGLAELRETIEGQGRLPMSRGLWDRFTGLAAARDAIGAAHEAEPFEKARIVEPGKNEWVVRAALRELGVETIEGEGGAEGERGSGVVSVIGAMSPGPMLDAAERLGGSEPRVVVPWAPQAELSRFVGGCDAG
ncbi:MAG: N-acetylglucosaminyl-diphospho-decaprenol L-rhamnosyltransferase [Phycisphaerales bacterium]